MPPGDAGRPYGTPAEEHAWDVANELRTENVRLRAQLAAQQAVVDAARRWRELAPECPAPWSSAMHFEHDCETARFHTLIGAIGEYDASQAVQPEGERA